MTKKSQRKLTFLPAKKLVSTNYYAGAKSSLPPLPLYHTFVKLSSGNFWQRVAAPVSYD